MVGVVSSSSFKGLWGDSFSKRRMNTGDTMVVPEKMLRVSGLKSVLDWAQVSSQLAIGAAVAKAFKLASCPTEGRLQTSVGA